MTTPDFHVISTDDGDGVTYTCGCPCTPTARPDATGKAGHEHCCCGKVHFVGDSAASDLAAYISDRQAKRKREPDYTFGKTAIVLGGREREVAWAFPVE